MSGKSNRSCICTRRFKWLSLGLGATATVVAIVGGIDQIIVNHSKPEPESPRSAAVSQTLIPDEVLAKSGFAKMPYIINLAGVVNVADVALPQSSEPAEKNPIGEQEKFPVVDVQVDTVSAMDCLIGQMMAAYNGHDFVEATNCAAKAEELYLAMTKPYVGKTITVMSNLVANLVFLYSFRAEEELVSKHYDKALWLANQASDLSIRDPWPKHEALRAVIVMRKGMRDAHSRVYTGKLPAIRWIKNEKKKKYEYLDCLASWGYLIPVEIDYKNLRYKDFVCLDVETNFPKRLSYPARRSYVTTFPDTGARYESDVCFDRWLGFDKFEKFNLSEHARRSIYDHFADRGIEILTPETVSRIR